MTILGLQRQIREVGRIRIGQQVTAANGRTRPAKLDTLRFTSRDKRIIEQVAEMYGGTVTPWDDQWEVVTETTTIPIMVPPADMALDQHYELWGQGLCRRRCDGQWDQVNDAVCACDPENRECSIHTRLWVMLPDVPGLGRWRLESQGFYAAVELAGVTELLAGLSGRNTLVPAFLRLEQRERKLLANGKPETRKFAVPVIDVDASLSAITAGMMGPGAGAPTSPVAVQPPSVALSPPPAPAPAPAPTPVGWRPVGEQPVLPVPPIAEQAAEATEPKARKPRKNAAEPIKPTGLKPGGGSAKVCHLCGRDWGDAPLVRNHAAEGNRYVHSACVAEGRDGGGGTSAPPDEVAPVEGEPAPTVTLPESSDEPITPEQMRMMMALAAKAFPFDGDREAVNEYVRNQVVAMAAKLGQEVESRRDLSKSTASALIDALQQIIEGTAKWNGSAFVNPETGEVFA